MTTPSDPLPTDLAAAHAVILAQREMLTIARSEVTVGRLEIERLKLMLAKARREQFGQSSERGKQLIEQLELAIEDLEETQAEVETKAEMAAPEAAKEKRTRAVRPARKPLPDNLPIERIVEPPPCACGKCGGVRLRKLGEEVIEDAGMRAAAMEDHRARAREVLVPGLRDDYRAAGAFPPDPARIRRPEPAGDDRCSPSSVSISRSIVRARPMRVRAIELDAVDAGRPGRRLRGGAGSDHSALSELMSWRAERMHGDDSVLRRHAERMAVMV